MNIIFVEPFFPQNQRRFVAALAGVGANVIGVGEYSEDDFGDELRSQLGAYYRVSNVTDEGQLNAAVEWAQGLVWVDRLESTIESHQMAAARVREARGIPGTSVRTTWLCRDKPSMKEALRQAGVPTAASTAAHSVDDAVDFANAIGFPLILKPRAGAGALGTTRVDSMAELQQALVALRGRRLDRDRGVRRRPRGFLRHDRHQRPRRARLDHALLPQRAGGHAAPMDLAAVRHHQPDR